MSDKSSTKPVILGFGLGLESTSVLCRWLFEPETRDFEVEDLVVLTMMTGGDLLGQNLRVSDTKIMKSIA